MKILVLNYEFPPLGGGAAPVSRDISIQLARQGHEVTVVTMGFGDLPACEEMQGVKIYRLKCLRTRKSSCKPWEQYTYLMAVRRFMKKHMLTHSYDICHTHFVIPTGEAARWVKRRYNIPYIITAHGSDVEGHNKKLTMKAMHRILRPYWRRIVDGSARVVSPSKYLMDLMRNNYDCGKYTCIPNGIEWSKYNGLSSPEYKTKNILIMGRLQKFKNVQTILNALSMVDLKDWTIDILGDGPYREELEKLSDRLGLSGKVTFHGWIDNGTAEQLLYIKKASVYITASQFENCPMSVIETVAAGCCPLLSDIPAHRQLIESDEYYFETNNPIELADKIKKVISNHNVYKTNVINVSRYDWNIIIKQYEKILQDGRN
jgi:glycosyltransferase involved in cell wall biosynthesis